MPDMDDLKKLADDHDDQIDKALEQAGDAAEKRIGHGDQIDKVVDKAQDATGNESK
jgi:MT0933-like antitoxin protein